MRLIRPAELNHRRHRLEEILETLGDGTPLTSDLRLLLSLLDDLYADGQVTLVIDMPMEETDQ